MSLSFTVANPVVPLKSQASWTPTVSGWVRVFSDSDTVLNANDTHYFRGFTISYSREATADYAAFDSTLCELRTTSDAYRATASSGSLVFDRLSNGAVANMSLAQLREVLAAVQVRIKGALKDGPTKYRVLFSVSMSTSVDFATSSTISGSAPIVLDVDVDAADRVGAAAAAADATAADTAKDLWLSEGMISVYVAAGGLVLGAIVAYLARSR